MEYGKNYLYDYRQGLSFREHLTQHFMSVLDTAMKAVMPPRRVRRAGRLVMRDDFNGASVDTSLWNYEVSMYGGYVRIVLFQSDAQTWLFSSYNVFQNLLKISSNFVFSLLRV